MQSLLKADDLKHWLHQDVERLDKLLLMLASFDAPCQVADLKRRAEKLVFEFRQSGTFRISSPVREARRSGHRTGGNSQALVDDVCRNWVLSN